VDDWDEKIEELQREARDNPVTDAENLDKVTFAQTVFYAREGHHRLKLRILRLGIADRACVVRMSLDAPDPNHPNQLKPKDICGKLDRYVLFDANETEKLVRLEITDDETWEGIRICSVSLVVEQCVRDTIVEGRGQKAYIVVADHDEFPENSDTSGLPGLIAFLKVQRKLRGVAMWKAMGCLAYMGIQGVIESLILKVL
jgi:hypothetical protein